MQWMDGVLSKGEKGEFFHDEFRCPVYVKDVVSIIIALTSRWVSGISYSIKAKMLVIGMINYKMLFVHHHSFGSYINS